ncbi:MAG: hypothetical protein QXH91_00685, partial [Candidatus Bathyarchaeia archaeon]
MAHWAPYGYGVAYFYPHENLEDCVLKLIRVHDKLKQHSATRNILALSGVDDVAFKPNPNLIQIKEKTNVKQTNFKVEITTPSEFFETIRKAENELEVVREDLNPVFQGCYSSRIKLKQYNRFLENMLYSCEAFSAIAWILGLPYSEDKLSDAWEHVLFSQFHDVIGGTCSDRTYEETMRGYKLVQKITENITKTVLNWLGELIDTHEHEIALIVFNPLPWKRTDIVSATISFKEPKIQSFSIIDCIGNRIPYQILTEKKDPLQEGLSVAEIQFIAKDVPALGYKVFYAVSDKKQEFKDLDASHGSIQFADETDKTVIENEFFRIEVDPWKGVITSIRDKQQGWEVVNQMLPFANTITKEPDNGDPWEINAPLRA